MYDKKFVREILTQIYQATQTVLDRFQPIKSADDFTSSDSGMEKLDAICMQLIAIGEGLKNLDKITGNALLTQYPEIECPALFYEFQEIGLNEKLGYKTPGDLRQSNAKFYWDVMSPYIQGALRYLRATQEGKQWVANLYANVLASLDGNTAGVI